MSYKAATRNKLSKNVLGMKFMRRSALNAEIDQNEEDTKRQIDDEHWVLDIPELKQKQDMYETEESYAVCNNLLFGRMSFQNFNPEIEKLCASKKTEEKEKESDNRMKDMEINDDEMTARYSNLIGTIAKKFKKQRPGNFKKRDKKSDSVNKNKHSKSKSSKTFMKPSDD